MCDPPASASLDLTTLGNLVLNEVSQVGLAPMGSSNPPASAFQIAGETSVPTDLFEGAHVTSYRS